VGNLRMKWMGAPHRVPSGLERTAGAGGGGEEEGEGRG
jgi:hypothetical protein